MSELRDDLDRALRALPVSEAPVERARRDGRRLRARRRAGALAGVVAVAAVAAGYPAVARDTASAPSGPATGATATPAPPHTVFGGDMVLTDSLPSGTTRGPGGLTDASGVIAQGKFGGQRWQLTVLAGHAAPVSGQTCFTVSGETAPAMGGPDCNGQPALADAPAGVPAAFAAEGDGTAQVVVGEAARDVTYFLITFADGQQLKLFPVTVAGHRYFGWIASQGMTIISVDAHLGGPYSDRGQVLSSAPFQLPGQLPAFGLWQRPGQSAPSRDSRVIGVGTADGLPWKVTAYEGPWGTCFAPSGGGAGCATTGRLTTTTIRGSRTEVGQPEVGSAAPGVATVRIALSDGTTVQVHPVGVGDEELFAFWVPKGVAPQSWTAYSARGAQAGSGTVHAVNAVRR